MLYQELYSGALDVLHQVTSKDMVKSSLGGRFGHIHGRDSQESARRVMQLARWDSQEADFFLAMARVAILSLVPYQGKDTNVDRGERYGEMPHEYVPARPDNHEQRVGMTMANVRRPWLPIWNESDQLGPVLNYDSIDATPKWLINVVRYWQRTGDYDFIEQVWPAVARALVWMRTHADRNNDGLLDYGWDYLSGIRVMGGHFHEDWDESAAELVDQNGEPHDSICDLVIPAGCQGAYWLAFRLWSDFFRYYGRELPGMGHDLRFKYAETLAACASRAKKKFNELFVVRDSRGLTLASNVVGKHKLSQTRDNLGVLLSYCLDPSERDDAKQPECIVDNEHIPGIVARVMQPDMFEVEAGVRTLSKEDPLFGRNHAGYHNGHIWTHRNGDIADGLYRFGYKDEAIMVCRAVLMAVDQLKEALGYPAPEVYVCEGGKVSLWSHHAAGEQQPWRTQVNTWSAAAVAFITKLLDRLS